MVRPVLFYEAEPWAERKTQGRKLDVTEMTCLDLERSSRNGCNGMIIQGEGKKDVDGRMLF